jgi:hypothetical protein
MPDFESNFENPEKKEELEDMDLWESKTKGVKIIRPNPSAIPLEEGVHLEVVKEERELKPHWEEENIKDLLDMGFYSLPASKVIAEGRYTKDFWANTHFNGRPGFEKNINIYGRSPESEVSWGKPVKMRQVEHSSQEEILPPQLKENLERTFSLYMELWEKIRPKIELFRGGIKPIVPDDNEFLEEEKFYDEKEDPYKEDLLWENEKFALVSVRNPHLTGFHLVCHPRKKYWKEKGGFKASWQTEKREEESREHIEGFLEALSILFGVERILSEEKSLNFNNPEIHFSGNWSKELQPVERGGKLSLDYLESEDQEKQRKREKRSHRISIDEGFKTAFHGHLYATLDPEEYVELPSRPLAEMPEEWEGIEALGPDKVEKIKGLIQEKLTPWLEKECQGKL